MKKDTKINFLTVSDFEKITGIKITNHEENGKLSGFRSLSTSCINNSICMERINRAICEMADAYGDDFVNRHPKLAIKRYASEHENALICGGCYARAIQLRYREVGAAMCRNSEILKHNLITDWPLLNDIYFRLESFGDVSTTLQVVNYFNFAKANKKTTFSVWTKNPEIYARAIDLGCSKPKNLIIILSSPFIGRKVDKSRYDSRYDFIDKVFTVYANEDQAAAAGVSINCGGHKCITCLKCYRHGGEVYINELLR